MLLSIFSPFSFIFVTCSRSFYTFFLVSLAVPIFGDQVQSLELFSCTIFFSSLSLSLFSLSGRWSVRDSPTHFWQHCALPTIYSRLLQLSKGKIATYSPVCYDSWFDCNNYRVQSSFLLSPCPKIRQSSANKSQFHFQSWMYNYQTYVCVGQIQDSSRSRVDSIGIQLSRIVQRQNKGCFLYSKQ